MAIVVTQSATAVRSGFGATFGGLGGIEPYSYAIKAGGAGGLIDAVTGNYVAPGVSEIEAAKAVDTIIVTDAIGATGSATVVIGSPLFLLAEIIQVYMGLAPGRVYFWDQKIKQPKDNAVYVAVGVADSKVFGNVSQYAPGDTGLNGTQFLAVCDTVSLDIISRGAGARDRKGDLLLALNSDYSQAQQSAYSFQIARLPSGRILNLSELDGGAIPYRFRVSVNLTYAYENTAAANYYSSLTGPAVAVDPLSSTESVISGGDITPEPLIISGGSA